MRARAIIHLDRFSQNIAFVTKTTGKPICVPVKADGYGHGALKIAETALKAGAFCLGVAAVSEGTELRRGGISCPILLFSQPHPDEIPETIESNLTPLISDTELISALNKHASEKKTKIPVHLKIDTGMGRLGCAGDTPDEALSLAKYISDCSSLELAGVATHFAAADSAKDEDKAYTQKQIALFKEAIRAIKDAGIDPGIVHAANSGAVLQYPEAWFDMVRPGILLYGYVIPENPELSGCHSDDPSIKPVMELRTVVSLIKKVKKGDSVSYGRTWIAPCDTNIAVLSIGYGDGLPRSVSNKWQAVINGKPYSLVGTICMDLCFADIGMCGKNGDDNGTVKQWDEAVIFGGNTADGAVLADAADLAKAAGTIPYEITCNINKRVEKVYNT